MSRFRILYIECNEDNTVGGSHQALFDLVNHLDTTQYEPVVAFRENNVFADRLRELGHEVLLFSQQRDQEQAGFHSPSVREQWKTKLYALQWRWSFLRQHRIHMVHLNNTPNIGYNTWLPVAHALRIPCLTNAMGEVAPVEGVLSNMLFRRYDKVIAISQYMKRECLRIGIPEDNIEVIYLGIDLELFRSKIQRSPQEVRQALNIPPDKLFVVMVGNIREWKGQHVVLEALKQLDQETRNKLLTIFVGAVSKDDQPYQDALHTTVSSAGLSDCVRFIGGRKDIPDIYHAANIALHASVEPEPFGLVVPEAMAAGTTIVATSIGGPGEILTPTSGLTYNPHYPEQLTHHLHTLAHDEDLRHRLAQEALLRVEEFSIQKHVANMEALYARILS